MRLHSRYGSRIVLACLAAALFAAGQAPAADWVNNGTYPWGSHTHNGNVYMVQQNAWLSSGWWYLRANQPGQDGKKYKSGVVYLNDTLKLRSNKAIGAQAYINTDAGLGIWPGFWITTLGGWTGEVDIAEWKGSGVVWQNTYDGGWENKTTTSNNSTYKTHVQAKNDGTQHAWVYLYINGAWQATHTGNNFVGKDWWLIFNLQMEGSAGSPGPTQATSRMRSWSWWGL